MASSNITVIIVNYNGGNRLLALLDALDRQTARHEVIIVDNASADGSARAAHAQFPGHRYLPLRRNTGFAHAVNLAARHADSELVVLLNPDTVPKPGFVEALTAPFDGRPRLAAVAGTLVFERSPEIIASAGIALHRNGLAIDRLLGEPLRNSAPEPVFGASGGAAAFRRAAFLEAGGFPEVFFMYQEDVDLAMRLQLAGWDALWQPAAVASHAYSASAGEGSPFKSRLIARNRIWTLARCLPRRLWWQNFPAIAAYDGLAFGYGLATDRAAARGRAEALARILPRLCERRKIAPDDGDVARLAAWLQPSLAPLEQRRLRRLTAKLAADG